VVDWTFCGKSPPLIIERDLIPPALKDKPQTQRDRGTDLNNVARQDPIAAVPGEEMPPLKKVHRVFTPFSYYREDPYLL
jgi:hypothetical protein